LGKPLMIVIQAVGSTVLPTVLQIHPHQLAEDRQVLWVVGLRHELREVDRTAASLSRFVGLDNLIDARPLPSIGGSDHPRGSSLISVSSRPRKLWRTRSTVRFERSTFSAISSIS